MDIQDVNIILSDRSKSTMNHFIDHANNATVMDLLTLGQSQVDKSWRAMWLLEKVLEKNKPLRTPKVFSKISEAFLKEESSSQLRHLLKILLMYKNETYNGAVVDKSFHIITSIHYDAAVRVHAMQVIYNMTLVYPEFAQELKPLLEEIIKMETKPSLLSRAKRIFKKLDN